MTVPIPALIDAFSLEAEFEAAKARIPAASSNRWTDTSNLDPGVVLIRAVLEEIERWVYNASARYIAGDVILHLGELLGAQSLPASAAEGRMAITVAPNTTVQQGFRVYNQETGQVYATQTLVSSVTGGTLEVEARALNAGAAGNVLALGVITSIQDNPDAGQVLAVTNITAFDGGREAETVAEFKQRLPGLIQNDTLLRIAQFEARARTNGAVLRAKVYRGLRPATVAGQFIQEADHMTVVLIGPNGAAPSQGVLDAVKADMLADTIFNLDDPNPALSGLHVIGVRQRLVGVTATLVLRTGADPDASKTAARNAVLAYLNPTTGGEAGTGFDFGRSPRLYEIGAALELVPSVAYTKDGTLVVTNGSNLAVDEIVTPDQTPGAIVFNTEYEQ